MKRLCCDSAQVKFLIKDFEFKFLKMNKIKLEMLSSEMFFIMYKFKLN